VLNVFDLSLKFSGFPIKKAETVLQNIQQITDNDYEAYVNEKKQAIVEFHLKNTPFYNTLAKNADPNNWNTIPVMTKADLQQPLNERLAKGCNHKNVYVNKTSGSSGTPFIFAKDKFCHALTWALIKNRFGWYGLDFNSSKQARFYGIPLDKIGYFKERLKDFLSNRYRFSVFDLSDEALTDCLEKFKTVHFDYMNGYTSSMVQFAKFLQKKNMQLKLVCPSLKVCIVTSEMLFEDDKTFLELQFGVPVVNEYGASELDIIAFQNPNYQWQVNSETLFVEILNEKNQVLPDGEEGRIVITSLYNKAHPFIRYDIGDIGIRSKQSTLKKPILEKLTGRTNDIIILPSGKKAAGLTCYYITKTIIEEDGNVKEFIIEQHKKDTFLIKYVSKNPLSDQKIKQISEEMETYLEKGLHIQFERWNNLKRSKSGKLKQFTSLIKETE